VLEMQGRVGDGIAFLSGGAPYWAQSFFAVHNWWHLALYELDQGDGNAALDLYDGPLRGGVSDQPLDLVDASSLLWRLKLVGFEAGQRRWQALAKLWQPHAEDMVYCFNDAHAMMAFLGAGEERQAEALRARLAARALSQDSNAMMTREVGLPLAEALIAYGQGRNSEAVDLLLSMRRKAHLFGGSHAQRDLIDQTLLAACARGSRHRSLGRALLNERRLAKPVTRLTAHWAGRLGVG